MSVIVLMKPYPAHPFKLFVLYLGKMYKEVEYEASKF
jgi:hypothetical protein